MRIWHIDLIKTDTLPKRQLIAQWRELNSIYAKKDKHILINFIYDYTDVNLYIYSKIVIDKCKTRGINIKTYDKFNNLTTLNNYVDINMCLTNFGLITH